MPRTRILNNLFTCTSYCMSLRMYIVTADRMFTPDKCKKWRIKTPDQVKELAKQTTHNCRIYKLTQEAVELSSFSKMRVYLR